jgi:signal peptidase II
MQLASSTSAIGRVKSTSEVQGSVRSRFFMLAGLAASFDLLTKAIATGLLHEGHAVSISDRLAFMLVYNTGGAGGAMVGPYTWGLNVAVTLVAIAMVVRIVTALAAVDPRATLALGLVTGGAFGNLASMLTGPEGVADFFAIQLGDHATIVMNVADLMLWSGALLLVPVVINLLRAIRAERVARS